MSPSSTSIPQTPTPSITPPPQLQICSPLTDVALDQLDQYVVNPFNPPRLGSDDPHQGVDLAILSDPDRIALAGAPVHAIISGQVAAVIEDRFPFGNAVMIETPLQELSPERLQFLLIPTPAPTMPPHPSLTCPQTGEYPYWNHEKRSLYLLYAHLQHPPGYQVNDQVACGDLLGTIGDSGNALNPHLHLELRVGPAGARFPGIAHYETRARPEEMEAYCIWRVSGIFQLLDPLLLFSLDPME